MDNNRYVAAWNELKEKMIKHGKLYPNSDLCSIPWNMMRELETKHGIPSKEVKYAGIIQKEE